MGKIGESKLKHDKIKEHDLDAGGGPGLPAAGRWDRVAIPDIGMGWVAGRVSRARAQ